MSLRRKYAGAAVFKGQINKLRERVVQLEDTLMELFELTKLLRSNGIPEQTVLINGILVTITKALQLNPITLQIMTKSQYDRARLALSTHGFPLTPLTQNPLGRGDGLRLNDVAILNAFLHYLCTESSELQTVSGMTVVISVLIFYYRL